MIKKIHFQKEKSARNLYIAVLISTSKNAMPFLLLIYSSMELEKSVEQVLPGRKRGGGRGWGRGQEGEMTQTMYAHVSK
jgi:hypothetical protein